MTTPKNNGPPSGILNAKNIIMTIIGVLTAWNTYTSEVTKGDLDVTKTRLEIQTGELNNVMKRKEFDNNLKFRLYEEEKGALVKPDPVIQNVVVLIINEMMADDSIYKANLTSILSVRVGENHKESYIISTLPFSRFSLPGRQRP